MSYIYRNPISTQIVPDTWSVTNTTVKGTNFSVFNIGGYMEVWSLNDLNFTDGGASSGPITYSGNIIPVEYTKSPNSNFIANNLTLEGDGISTGRRRLGMLVYVHETQQTYQYIIPDYETLFNDADSEGSIQTNVDGNTGQIVSYTVKDRLNASTPWPNGGALISAWLDSSIEGVSGVTRENARWRVFWGTDWQVTGGTVTYDSEGTLSLFSNSGNTVNITGLKTLTGGTFVTNTSTLTLYDNLGGEINVSGFTSGDGGVTVGGKGVQILGSGSTETPYTANTVYNTSLSNVDTVEDIGGLPAGTSVSSLTGKSLVEIFDDILFPTVQPTYTTPTLSLNGLSNRTREVGTTESININAYAVKNDAGDWTSLRIKTGTTIPSVDVIVDNSPTPSTTTDVPDQFGYTNPNNPNSGFTSTSLSYTLTIPAPTTGNEASTVRYEAEGDCDAGLPKLDNKGNTDVRTPGTSTNTPQAARTDINTSDAIVTGVYPYWYGTSSTQPTISSIQAAISGGTAEKSDITNNQDGTLTITFDADGEYCWFAHFEEYETKRSYYVTDINKEDFCPSCLFNTFVTGSIDSPNGYWSGVNYKIYITNLKTTTTSFGAMQLRTTTV